MSRWVEANVVSQKQWTPSLYSLYVKAPIEPFIAGQFTQIGLMNNEKILFRPYSFVNSPDDPILEFYYTHLAEGELTNRLIHLQSKDTLYVAKKGSGRFTLSHVPDADVLWLIATGTGIGVFLSLLRTKEIEQRFAKIVLIHSVRQQNELTHQDVIASIKQHLREQFHFIPIVTGERISGVLNARIQNLIIDNQLEQHANAKLTPHAQVMLCGNPAMVKAVTMALGTKGLLLNQGQEKGHITVESYWKE